MGGRTKQFAELCPANGMIGSTRFMRARGGSRTSLKACSQKRVELWTQETRGPPPFRAPLIYSNAKGNLPKQSKQYSNN